MQIFESILNIITKLFSLLGTSATGKPCGGFFDEPEVPKELTELYE
ncbi:MULTISPECIES: cyclic lactone autoinducer peptide AgrD [Staphylococcus]|uniref:Cyclic lactone autoinducer peptide n=1 Tax=Staphylococcus hsinchuensis TaxID=3051183 RepID=A0ABZ3ECH7_9STAP|nr:MULTISPECIES: cyclic lactone autoinducer peptide [unclassified Staphylococcus]